MDFIWIPITLGAAACQAVRTALQRQIAGDLGPWPATFVRCAYGAPLAGLYLLVLSWCGLPAPLPTWAGLGWAALGGLAQILATAALLAVMTRRNLPVGTALSKTEVLQAGLFGLVVLGDPITPTGLASISIATMGVILLSLPDRRMPGQGFDPGAAALGLASGGLFAVSGVCFRAASLAISPDQPFTAAAMALVLSTCTQALMLGPPLVHAAPGQILALARDWRRSFPVGLASMVGSAGWFTAMSLRPVADVRTLGLFDLVVTFALSHFWLKEAIRLREVAGVLLVAGAIVLLLQGL
ncbi:DMT family transporter [Zavarzinia sp. CC-PAN008]|uniref:DMT family transporter n=1 Tax=Zavarzinia sp. CC-PAN008 TaxID=3243332 RepID=UPI003F743328